MVFGWLVCGGKSDATHKNSTGKYSKPEDFRGKAQSLRQVSPKMEISPPLPAGVNKEHGQWSGKSDCSGVTTRRSSIEEMTAPFPVSTAEKYVLDKIRLLSETEQTKFGLLLSQQDNLYGKNMLEFTIQSYNKNDPNHEGNSPLLTIAPDLPRFVDSRFHGVIIPALVFLFEDGFLRPRRLVAAQQHPNQYGPPAYGPPFSPHPHARPLPGVPPQQPQATVGAASYPPMQQQPMQPTQQPNQQPGSTGYNHLLIPSSKRTPTAYQLTSTIFCPVTAAQAQRQAVQQAGGLQNVQLIADDKEEGDGNSLGAFQLPPPASSATAATFSTVHTVASPAAIAALTAAEDDDEQLHQKQQPKVKHSQHYYSNRERRRLAAHTAAHHKQLTKVAAAEQDQDEEDDVKLPVVAHKDTDLEEEEDGEEDDGCSNASVATIAASISPTVSPLVAPVKAPASAAKAPAHAANRVPLLARGLSITIPANHAKEVVPATAAAATMAQRSSIVSAAAGGMVMVDAEKSSPTTIIDTPQGQAVKKLGYGLPCQQPSYPPSVASAANTANTTTPNSYPATTAAATIGGGYYAPYHAHHAHHHTTTHGYHHHHAAHHHAAHHQHTQHFYHQQQHHLHPSNNMLKLATLNSVSMSATSPSANPAPAASTSISSSASTVTSPTATGGSSYHHHYGCYVGNHGYPMIYLSGSSTSTTANSPNYSYGQLQPQQAAPSQAPQMMQQMMHQTKQYHNNFVQPTAAAATPLAGGDANFRN